MVIEGQNWVLRRDLVAAHEVWRRLKHDFPELQREIEHDQDLVHLTLGALEHFANQAIAHGDFAALERAYSFVVSLVKENHDLHPDVLNAIHVSFLEGLYFDHSLNGERAKDLLPPILLGMWEAMMAHYREIGRI